MTKQLIFKVLATVASLYFLWQLIIPVEIVAAHDGDVLLVRHFPHLKSRQIAWWEANKEKIQNIYKIPQKDKNGYYDIFIHDFGDGYRMDSGTDEDSDLLCFEDIKVAANCIKKSPLLWIGSAPNEELFYY